MTENSDITNRNSINENPESFFEASFNKFFKRIIIFDFKRKIIFLTKNPSQNIELNNLQGKEKGQKQFLTYI